MKTTINLTEQQLKRVVEESVKRILNEAPYCPFKEGTEEWREWVFDVLTPSLSDWWKAKHPEWSKEECTAAAKGYYFAHGGEKFPEFFQHHNGKKWPDKM